ncbi:MAG TPA: ABC transporter substrate-binding protein [Symbiobacteriaceae bacterium]|nr:ABC transporter substrate-binding protein [Symbiobacteriaceae bacterium]
MRYKVTVSALAMALLLLSGCQRGEGPHAPAGQLHKVRFTEVIHSIFYAPQYVAQAKGFFAEEGIDLDFSTAQGSDKGTAALLAGTADIALVGPETTVFVYQQETPNKVKLFAQITTTDGSFLVARQPDPNFAWEKLQGKSVVGWRPGSMPQLVAGALFKRHGVTDLNYISNLSAPAMAGAFQSGQGDYLQVFEPIVSQLEKAGVAYPVAAIGPAYGDVPYTGYTATDEYIKKNPEIIQAYTNAIYKAMLYLQRTDPAVVAKEVAPYFEGTDPALLESSIRRYQQSGGWKQTPDMNPADFEKLQALMVEGGVLDAGKKAPFAAIATNQFAEKAIKEIK